MVAASKKQRMSTSIFLAGGIVPPIGGKLSL
jgi:hypothetical protein